MTKPLNTTAIALHATRAQQAIKLGVERLYACDPLAAEVAFRAALGELRNMIAELDGTEKPRRKICIVRVEEVQVADREPLPQWMDCKHGEPNDAA